MYIKLQGEKIPIVYCNTFMKRLIGMAFKKEIQNAIYCFPKCSSIHTFFMFQNIDVIMTDKRNHILYIYENIKPNHIIFPKKDVYYTYELSHNSAILDIVKNNNEMDIRKKED